MSTDSILNRDVAAARIFASTIGMTHNDVYAAITRPAWDTSDREHGNYINYWEWMPESHVALWIAELHHRHTGR